jgi:hypothetical protein
MQPRTFFGFRVTALILALAFVIMPGLVSGTRVSTLLATLELILNLSKDFTLCWWGLRLDFGEKSLILLLQLEDIVVQLDLFKLGLPVGILPVSHTIKELISEDGLSILRPTDRFSEFKDVFWRDE